VVIFATAAGQIDPPGVDGQVAGNVRPSPILPVSVTIGGVDSQILYADGVSGLISGVLKVNCLVDESVIPVYAVPIVLTVGPTSSPQGVTVAIQ
jgi:uncharacterized protein (TIGR03437 family)